MTAIGRPGDPLADRVAGGLESRSDALRLGCPDPEHESLELAAAAIVLAFTAVDEPLPAAIRDRLSRQARDFYRRQ